MRDLVPAGIRLVPQDGADLGMRMNRLLTNLWPRATRGDRGRDGQPDLRRPTAKAFAAIRDEAVDLVLAPAEDDSYYLIGPAPRPPRLSRTSGGARTRCGGRWPAPGGSGPARAAAIWFDVDRGEDPRASALRPTPRLRPPRTLAFLEDGGVPG